MAVKLIPSASTYEPGAAISVDIGGDLPEGQLALVVTSLLDEVARLDVPTDTKTLTFAPQRIGGYGVALLADGVVVARTAFDVLADPFDRPRYGFVAQLDANVDILAVATFFRRLHLNVAQFYDWGYRHSELLPPTREYLDPLGQPRDLAIVDALADALSDDGVVPLGYAAVYAVGNDQTDAWSQDLLLRADGAPYRLGEDFLTLVDPGSPRWLEYFGEMLGRALDGTRLRGFHLDQYGWPKRSLRGDGQIIDLDESFATMITAVRDAMPQARIIFNNVNDFGTARTAAGPQDATYIEVWPPHDTLGDLGALATRTRALRPAHPPILSAYLSCYGIETQERADAAARLVMASCFSHGATHLLLGESGHALIDPYYPRNHTLPPESVADFADWYDTAVRWGDLLYDPEQLDVTEFTTGGINNDIVLSADGVRFSTKAEPGTVWTRVVRTRRGLVIHLINLLGQADVRWDAGKEPAQPVGAATLAIAPVTGRERPVWIEPGADPVPLRPTGSTQDQATDALSASQTVLTYTVPALTDWGFVYIPFDEVADLAPAALRPLAR